MDADYIGFGCVVLQCIWPDWNLSEDVVACMLMYVCEFEANICDGIEALSFSSSNYGEVGT